MNRHARCWCALIPGVVLGLATARPAAALEFDYDPARAAALRACDADLERGRPLPARRCYQALLTQADPLLRAESAWALGDLKTANTLFRDAVAADAKGAPARVRWGRLYLAAHQYAESAKLFGEALQIDPKSVAAKLGLLQLGAERFEGGAEAELEALTGGDTPRIEAPLLLARLRLEQGDTAAATTAANRALELAERQQRAPLEALSLLAAIELVAGRDPQRHVDRATAFNPRYGDLYATLAHYEVMRRRYREADVWLRRAVEVEPDNWPALEELGVNALRLGDAARARPALERAYAGDPFSATTVNTLRVLDSLSQYDVIATDKPALRLQLQKKESAALRPYVEALARRSVATFSERYGYTPVEPIAIELYPNHDDFAVRTAGLPGIGLLGVTFGHVVAMDSPSGRRTGEFHWGSTLWHEMAHVFTLSATQHRVPRWLSEGLSVFEEWRTGPTPGVAVEPRILDAYAAGRFLPVAKLDEGFIRPAYEGQVQVSYAQAGLTCLFIEQQFGFARLAAFLREFASDNTVEPAVQATFGIASTAFDAQFNAFLKQRFAPYLADTKRLKALLQEADAQIGRKAWDAAAKSAREAIRVMPEFTTGENGYTLLTAAQLGADDRPAAMQTLLAWRAAGGWDPAGLRQLASLLQEAGRPADATVVREAVNLVDPLKPADHAQLGELLLAAGRPADALTEYTVLLQLDPQDPAAAHLGAARALAASGNAAPARRHLLQALEIAPHFRPAQTLLLELRGESPP
jgi:tetratricopeptide (TPR) repeat protein